MTVLMLSESVIADTLKQAQVLACPPDGRRCVVWSSQVTSALGPLTSDGWCVIGGVDARAHGPIWRVWFHVDSGEVRHDLEIRRPKQRRGRRGAVSHDRESGLRHLPNASSGSTLQVKEALLRPGNTLRFDIFGACTLVQQSLTRNDMEIGEMQLRYGRDGAWRVQREGAASISCTESGATDCR